MPSGNFRRDLAAGQNGEARFASLVDDPPRTTVTRSDGRNEDCVLRVGPLAIPVEVKTDFRYAKTGNIAVEFQNPKTGRDTGIRSTPAELWVYVLGQEVWAASARDLRAAVEDGIMKASFRVVVGAGDGNASVALLPGAEVLGTLFTRLDADNLLVRRRLLSEVLSKTAIVANWVVDEYTSGRLTGAQIGRLLRWRKSRVYEVLHRERVEFRETAAGMVGRKFGSLEVIDIEPCEKYGMVCVCRCECGEVRRNRTGGLKSGHFKSCGSRECRQFQPTSKSYGEISGTYWCCVKSGAESRGLVFDVLIQDCWELFLRQGRRCALSGVPLAFPPPGKVGDNNLMTASLDRIDSSLGYTIDNVQWIHKDLNQMKMARTDDEFARWCAAVAIHKGLALPLADTSLPAQLDRILSGPLD